MSQLLLWKNVSKKRNSTWFPTSNADYTLDVYMKEDTSVDTPSFLLELSDLSVNYAYWEGRYYFVDNITRGITGQYIYECTTDYLATYKTQIGNYTAFVERADSEFDVQINDDAISQKQSYQIDEYDQVIDAGAVVTVSSGGCYVVRVVGNQNMTQAQLQNSPGIVSYLVPPWKLLELLDWAFNTNNYSDVLTDPAVKSFFNPFQYIVDVNWVPLDWFIYDLEHPTATRNNIALGWWNTSVSGIVIENTPEVWAGNFPAVSKRWNDFRDTNSNWTRFKVYFPLIGNIDIDPVDYYAGDLYYRYYFDPVLGDGVFTICHGSTEREDVIFIQSLKFGRKIQIGQIATDLKNVASNLAGGFASMATGNFIAGTTGVVNGILNAIQPTPSLNGQPESRINYYYSMAMNVLRYTSDAAEIPRVVYGRPLCKNKQISTLSGYIKCAAASVDIPGFASDKEAVNAALNGGFYYE